MNVIYMAGLQDPTDDGILTTLANYALSGLMVLVVIVGGWHAFKEWNDKKGANGTAVLRDHAISILAIEAFLGGILLIANRGTDIIPGLG
ncbi:hypothetical protein H7J07_06130 [Mycobacterium koreense]|uniref:Uncharacterized protein n=1 Tax=Mycolicibacillus koreensis TaxID=1069220 RepID=A0A7I7SBC7_9MYCO|nr:hypothetical protein [Mycolicibacillus koreensis]MCV7247805.1 hypothetical protein [Mycolicibacillus koreensis]OSC34679.1 hypothetical protein B8W67_05375 [Mycolicibacillus koreensis]BBY54192.1 hypothetical protein MKOR_14430 [Mycolicibacillus koreensis]